MYVNNLIAVENLASEKAKAIEKLILFYPKIPQKILNFIIDDKLKMLAQNKLKFT